MSPSLSSPGGALDAALIDREQTAVHGFAWMATYVEALRQIRGWASRLDEAGEFGEAEALILRVAFGEYLAQLAGGIAMSQAEIVRPHDLGLSEAEIAPLRDGDAGASRRRARRGARRVWRRCSRRASPAAFGRNRAGRPDARNDPRSGPPLRRARRRAVSRMNGTAPTG